MATQTVIDSDETTTRDWFAAMPRVASRMMSAVLVVAVIVGFAFLDGSPRHHPGLSIALAAAVAVALCVGIAIVEAVRRRRS